MLGQVIHHEINELQLVRGQGFALDEPVEGRLGGFPVQAHQGTDEEPQAMGLGRGLASDAFAGSLVFLTLSGMLLWTRLSGPRMLAVVLALGGLLTIILIAARGW